MCGMIFGGPHELTAVPNLTEREPIVQWSQSYWSGGYQIEVKPWEVTAITNFAAAGEAFLAAGFLLGRTPKLASAQGFWAAAMLCFAVGFLLGGIDHGFFEPKGNTTSRLVVQKISWFFGGAAYLITLRYFNTQMAASGAFCFCRIGTAGRIPHLQPNPSLPSGYDQLHSVLLVLFILNLIWLSSGSGSLYMVFGIAASVLAARFEAIGIDAFTPIDRHGDYHLVMMAAVALFFGAFFQLKA